MNSIFPIGLLLIALSGLIVVLHSKRNSISQNRKECRVKTSFVDHIELTALKAWIKERKSIIENGRKITVVDLNNFKMEEFKEILLNDSPFTESEKVLAIITVDKNGQAEEILYINYNEISDEVINLLGDEHMLVVK